MTLLISVRAHSLILITVLMVMTGVSNAQAVDNEQQKKSKMYTPEQIVAFTNNEIRDLLSDKQYFQFNSLSKSELRVLGENRTIVAIINLLIQYRSLEQYAWPEVVNVELAIGKKSKEIAKLRWMLTKLYDLQPHSLNSYREQVYDPSITSGIKSFQNRHGLIASGELTPETITQLNTQPRDRSRQLVALLIDYISPNRLKVEEYVEVNIPSYQLKVIKNTEEVMSLKVIVGAKDTKTPLLNTKVTSLTVNPNWTVPVSIINKDIVNQLNTNNSYLKNNSFFLKDAENNQDYFESITVQDFRKKLKGKQLVQAPGKKNALGKLRFTTPNDKSIFLHDTPSKGLFDLDVRALSHGCIRVENPNVFAEFLISRESSLKNKSFMNSIGSDKTVNLKFENPIPLFITYKPLWIDTRGVLQIRPDVYSMGGE
ncbi:L,D-transpeptidase family protein [Shewanella sp. 10N.286.54.B9]|uniref:L,D-transpeptidase family protein n=1 Tax=Shewanella sp. 10N.286.54.B9 TaxID=3229719 RepID=UPI003550BEE9